MILYIVRHAIAVEKGKVGVADEDRDLTPEGIEKMKEAALGLRAINAFPDILLTSPLVRTRHTAEILIEAFDGKPGLNLEESLAPSGSRLDLYRRLRRHEKADSIMLVGHRPSLNEIVGEIAWGSAECTPVLKKGGACAIRIDALDPVPRGDLLWLMPPSVLRRLA